MNKFNFTNIEATRKVLYRHRLFEILDGYNEGIFKEVRLITIFDENDNELGFAAITPHNNFILEKVFCKNFEQLLDYSPEEYNSLFLEYKEVLNECSYLNLIRIHNKNMGTGRVLVNYLKENFNSMWLYSLIQAEKFWSKNEFVEINSGDHNYYYQKK